MTSRRVGGCRIEKTLSRGAHSLLYQAYSEELARPMVIKVLDPHYPPSSRTAQRFLRGGQIARELEHPNIVQIFAAGQENNILYMLTEFLEGHSLDKVLSVHKRVGYRTACDIVRQIAQAMEYAAGRKVVHRMIEPSHIMLSPGSHVTMLGFGMARLSEAQDHAITAEGALVGITPYSCPEIGQGVQDIRGDLYSLGCVFYHMLTGQPPFAGRDLLELLHKHRTALPRPITDLIERGTPLGVLEIVDSLMYKELEKRIQTPAELIACLDAVVKPDMIGEKDYAPRADQTVIVTTRQLMALRQKRTVLVCDPQPYNVQLVQEVLRRLGFRILATRDGQTALNAASKERPDLLITDIKLPRVTGTEYLAQMIEFCPGLSIILTRGGQLTESIIKKPEFQNAESIERPLEPDNIRAAVQRMLS